MTIWLLLSAPLAALALGTVVFLVARLEPRRGGGKEEAATRHP